VSKPKLRDCSIERCSPGFTRILNRRDRSSGEILLIQ
jgi:hypothetical protein